MSTQLESADAPAPRRGVARFGQPTPTKLLLVWLKIGATSFGGGIATQTLIYANFVVQREWLTPERFTQLWAIVQFAPGVNLLAFAVLIGKLLGGAPGIVASLFGLVVPSAGITIAMTALYTQIRALPATQAALMGITPALLGLSLAFSWRLLRPTFAGLKQHGNRAVALGASLLAASVLLAALDAQILMIYAIGCVIVGVAYWRWGR